jgi:hypothetical protein
MPKLTLNEVERLINKGVLRDGCSVEAYRERVRQYAERADIPFEAGLLLVEDYETMLPNEREQMRNALHRLREEAARLGCTVEEYREALRRLYEEQPRPR